MTLDYVLIIHQVKDYAAWKRIFNAAAPIRKAAGERSYQLLRAHSDANRIVHFSQWTSIADARAFFESPQLIEIRRLAGVEAPEFHYLNGLEQGIL